jgi:hypothetical protein
MIMWNRVLQLVLAAMGMLINLPVAQGQLPMNFIRVAAGCPDHSKLTSGRVALSKKSK